MAPMDNATSTGPASTTPRPQLRRSSEHRVIAGVARGLGDHTGLDPLLFRLGFAALALVGGFGILLYLLAWVVIPSAGSVQQREWISLRRLALFVLIGGIAVVYLANGGLGGPAGGGGALLALGLIAVGVLLLRDDSPASTVTPRAIDTDRIVRLLAKRRSRKRSPLAWLAIAAALLAVGLVGLLNNLGATSLPPGRYPAIALSVFGVGLLIAARYGRARILILIGLLVLPIAFVASPITVPLKGRLGGYWESPRVAANLDSRYDVLLGDLVLDLGQLTRKQLHEDIEVEVNSVAGQVTAYVPEWMDLAVTADIDVGSYRLAREIQDSGVDLAVTHERPGTRNMGSLSLDVRGGMVALNVISLDERRIWASEAQRARREAARIERQARIERRRERMRRRTLEERRRLRDQLERIERQIQRLESRTGGRRG
jgi:phage shock protein PspC (stress-responsive transcriptional regulator)